MIQLLATRCRELLRSGSVEAAELYAKRSRTRTVRHEADGGRHELRSAEEGWSLRFGDRRRSGFLAGTGAPESPLVELLPEPDGLGLDLAVDGPHPGDVASQSADRDLDQPLFGPAEGASILDTVRTVLERELRGARLDRAVLEEGVAEHFLVVDEVAGSEAQADPTPQRSARWRTRTAALLVEARLRRRTTRWYLPLSSSRAARPQAVARRLADRLYLLEQAQAVRRDRCEVLLSAELSAALLAASWPVWSAIGVASKELETPFDLAVDPFGEGPLRSPRDGLGRSAERRFLVRDGTWLHSPRELEFWQRPSWRHPPSAGPGQLVMRSELGQTVGSLLSSMARGIYLVEARVGSTGDQLLVLGHGFAVRQGRASGPVGPLALRLPIENWLASVRALGRDLEWATAGEGAFSSPSLLLRRVEIAPAQGYS